jgi:hypothetical protein
MESKQTDTEQTLVEALKVATRKLYAAEDTLKQAKADYSQALSTFNEYVIFNKTEATNG